MLTASRERGVIGCREIDAQHPDDRCHDALGLTQRYVEDETERQRGFDGEIGILELPAPPADASRSHVAIASGVRQRVTPEAIATWEAVGVGKRGGQLQYSEVAIETALTLRLIFHLPLRQTEGFLRSIFGMLGVDLSAPDHTTLSRRGQHLDLALRRLPAGAGIHLIVDSTGLSTVGEGEWAAVKHGGRGRRGWKKLHLGVDGSGVIVAHALTGGHVDDATTALDLIDKVEGDVSCLTADAAYDTRGIYEAAGARGATVVIPPTRTATVSGRRPRSPARDRTIRQVQQAGRRQWKKDSGYHQQARMENAFFRYKVIIGESLRARSRAGQETEAILACNILNQMTQLGRPASYAIGR